MAIIPEPLIHLFATLGLFTTIYASTKVFLSILRNVNTFFLAGPLGLGTNPARQGKWAVVTGATDGIGKAYAEQLASKGMSIFLMSRSADKLKDVATQIGEKYNVETKTLAVDFCGNADIYGRIKEALAELEIGVLINNVGMSYSFPQFLTEIEDVEKFLPNIININCLTVVMMSYLVLPSMIERRKGVIINVSSASAMNPSPMLTAYSATKAFVDFFSRGLNTEYASKGIIVQSVLPFYVTTKLSKLRRETITIPSPKTYVKSALLTVGLQDRTNGCLMHNLQAYVVDLAPEWLLNRVQMSLHTNIRRINLKKLEQKKAK
ncbi:very-long-chain 3-oxoacyl-CoA reductase-B-like [Diadema antillarum]|uniref:very-long-chain 3-oxoacyl-CoA reductase-B-like n=1 Tax=Diadema antillarum TaxID=105358 RepID=UPI003A87C032